MFETKFYQAMRSIRRFHAPVLKTSQFGARLAVASAILGGAGCGAVDPEGQTDPARVGQIEEGISGGNLATNNNAPFNAVVKLPGCTGTKIGPRRFLTAG